MDPTALASTLAALSGISVIPTRGKFKGASKGTSVASVVARAVFGRMQFQRQVPAPTAKNFRSRSRLVGTVVGRWTPIIGGTGMIMHGFGIGRCTSGCIEKHRLDAGGIYELQ